MTINIILMLVIVFLIVLIYDLRNKLEQIRKKYIEIETSNLEIIDLTAGYIDEAKNLSKLSIKVIDEYTKDLKATKELINYKKAIGWLKSRR